MTPDDVQRIREHAELHQQLASARARISELEAMHPRLASEIARLKEAFEAADAHAVGLAAEAAWNADKVARMQASISWRMTAPLRAIRRALIDRKRRNTGLPAQLPPVPGQTAPAVIAPPSPAADTGPTMAGRSDYKNVWNRQSGDPEAAKLAVAGYTDEAELVRTARRTEELLAKTTGLKTDDVILEIGCGVGRVGAVLAPRCRHWIGTDISGNMITHARERMKDLPNVTLVELATVGLGEIPDTSVDVVYCTVVFMHLYEWDRWRYVQESFRVLKPGGRCYFDNMAIGSEHGWQMFLAGAAWPLDRRPAHLSMVSSAEELETYAKRAGFSDVQIHRFDEGWVAVTGVKH